MLGGIAKTPVEVFFAGGMLAITLLLSALFGLPIRLPSHDLMIPLVATYLVPLTGAVAYSIYALLARKRTLLRELVITLPCFWVVLIAYFNLKLWTPFINPLSFDGLFWQIDQALRPLVDFCFGLRRALVPIVPYEWNLYLTGFLLLFYISFLYHSTRTPQALRRIVVSAMFLQGLGALTYIALPAIGPFLYEPGSSTTSNAAEQMMLQVRQQSVAGGPHWLSGHASSVLMAGLGAMPSLHVGYAWLFLWYAIREARVLLPTYVPLFVFIVFTSVASRWHYLIDLPAGLALSAFSIWLAARWVPVPVEADPAAAPEPVMDGLPGFAPAI